MTAAPHTHASSNVDVATDLRARADGAEHPACDVCPHAADSHDAIGLRYCQATLDGALSRGCVCRSA